ncbi:alpha/beta fold hydrolase [Kitasatospora sp. NPDC059599]|uniref:alpha/beta fold hydrolase n=1 Tax=Kitasatospora sp. NPDC059599 TaxID=3346880 RepID=UPI00367678AF
MVLLHGRPQTWYEWRHLIPVPAREHPVIAPDLRGWGETERPAVRSGCECHVNTWVSAGQVRKAARRPLDIPVPAVAGEHSPGQHMIDFVRRLAPEAQGVVLPGCGHLVPEERPAELARLVTDFLAGAPGTE